MDKKKATTSYTTHKRGSLITYTKDEKKSHKNLEAFCSHVVLQGSLSSHSALQKPKLNTWTLHHGWGLYKKDSAELNENYCYFKIFNIQ